MESQPAISQRNTSPGSGKRASTRSKYASRACQECRRRRAKCDAEKPSCARCLQRGIDCVYNTGDENRGTAPRSLVRLLQARIKKLEDILWLHSIDINIPIGDNTSRDNIPVNDTPASLTRSTASHQVHTKFDNPSGTDGHLNFGDHGEPFYFGSSSGRAELLRPTEGANEEPGLSLDAFPRFPHNMYSQAVDSTLEISKELQEHLISLYFEWEQPWFQLVDETLFRESWKENGRYCNPLLLNCIFALGSRYSDRTEVRSNPEDPNTAGQLFLELAEVLLHFDLKSPSIITIQSLAMMAILYVATGSDAKGWLCHGMAICLGLDMGFNLDSSTLVSSNRLPATETRLREQLYWALYCTDKLWATYTGRICTMLDFQSTVSLPPPASIPVGLSPGSLSPAGGSIRESLHHALCTHCQILEKILINLYAPKSLPQGAQRRSFFDSCLLELKTWKYTLPAELNTKVAGKSSNYPHSYVLNMVYHTSIILLAKPFLPKRINPALAQTDPRSRIEDDVASKAASLCMDAAKNVCLLAEHYRETFGSFRRAPITVTHCTLSAALMLLYGPAEVMGQHSNAELIQSCVVTLKELSDSWMPAQEYWCSVLCIFRDRQRTFGTPKETPSTRPVPRSIHKDGEPLHLQDLGGPSRELFQSPVSDLWADASNFPEVAIGDLNLAGMFPLGSLCSYDDFEALNIPSDLPS